MTQLLHRNRATKARRAAPMNPTASPTTAVQAADRPRPTSVAGLLVAASAATLGLAVVVLLCLVAWATSPHQDASLGSSIDVALQLWLLAHHTGLAVAGGHIALVPLGLTALPAWLLVRAGRAVARLSGVASLGDAVLATIAVALPYGVFAALVTGPAATAAVRPMTVQALVGATVLALVAAGYGIAAETGLRRRVSAAMPAPVRAVLAGGGLAVVVLAATGTVVVAASLGAHAGRIGDLTEALAPGPVGMVLVVLLCGALAPNAVVWSASVATGPGFAVGSGTSVALGGVHLAEVPAFPLLAALPASGDAPHVLLFALLGPMLAGVAAGAMVLRAGRREAVPVASRPSVAVLLAGVRGPVRRRAVRCGSVAGRRPARPRATRDTGPVALAGRCRRGGGGGCGGHLGGAGWVVVARPGNRRSDACGCRGSRRRGVYLGAQTVPN